MNKSVVMTRTAKHHHRVLVEGVHRTVGLEYGELGLISGREINSCHTEPCVSQQLGAMAVASTDIKYVSSAIMLLHPADEVSRGVEENAAVEREFVFIGIVVDDLWCGHRYSPPRETTPAWASVGWRNQVDRRKRTVHFFGMSKPGSAELFETSEPLIPLLVI